MVLSLILVAWYVFRKTDFEHAVAVALAAGLLISYHSYVADSALLIPACLTILAGNPSLPSRFLAIALLMPIGYFFILIARPPLSLSTQIATVLLVYMAGFDVFRRTTNSARQAAQGIEPH